MKILMQNRYDSFAKRGGDTYQMLLTKKYLEQLGVSVDISFNLSPPLAGYDIVHPFNITRVHETYAQIINARKQGKKVVLSPIYHSAGDIRNYETKNLTGFHGLAARSSGNPDIVQLFKTFYYTYRYPPVWKSFFAQLMTGFTQQQKRCIELSDMIIPNTMLELNAIKTELFAGQELPSAARVIFNGIEKYQLKESGKMADWVNKNGLSEFAVCAGRIEPRKNQLMILQALEGTPHKIVFAGRRNNMHRAYFRDFTRRAGLNSNAYYLGELPQDELMTLYSMSKVSILASWFETTGLTGLEAGQFGCNAVITEKGYTREYYGDSAWYCDPESAGSIRAAVQSAFEAPRDAKKLKNRIFSRNFSWENSAKETLETYKSVLKA